MGAVSEVHSSLLRPSEGTRCTPGPTVAVVVTTYNDARFLPDAMASIMGQTDRADEIFVVDDGSDPAHRPDISAWPGVILIQKSNGGLASARNAGLARCSADLILFLDVDDILAPQAIEIGKASLSRNPEAAFTYGAHRRVDAMGHPLTELIYHPVSIDAWRDFLALNHVGMHATVLYRARILKDQGGFDESLRLGEDYDAYLRLARGHAIATHPDLVADYRWHGGNVSRDHQKMLDAILQIHEKHKPQERGDLRAWRDGRRNWRRYYYDEMLRERRAGQRSPRALADLAATMIRSAVNDPSRASRRAVRWTWRRGAGLLRRTLKMGRGPVHAGGFGSLEPVSRHFGYDRGRPIDRFYIEGFLARHADHIRGRVLEIGDDAYSKAFGHGRILKQDVLHVSSDEPPVTLTGDLSSPGVLPQQSFDCIILTQTLQFIFDFDAALKHVHAALKPDGVLLLTVPGISPIDHGEWRKDWFWSFTQMSMQRLLARYFEAAEISIEVHGNVFAATAFLQGLAVEDVDEAKLRHEDECYPVIVAVRARKSTT